MNGREDNGADPEKYRMTRNRRKSFAGAEMMEYGKPFGYQSLHAGRTERKKIENEIAPIAVRCYAYAHNVLSLRCMADGWGGYAQSLIWCNG